MVNLGPSSGGIGGAFGGSFSGAFMGGASVQIVIRAIDAYSKEFKNATTAAQKLGTGLKWLGVAAAGAIVASSKLAIQYERTEMAFTSMLGSATKAKALLEELRQFTRRTPFVLPELEENARLLLGMGIEAKELVPTMSMLGDVASALNVPFWRMALNFGQVKTQTKLMGTELRDFGRMGVPLIEALTKVTGKTAEEIKSMKGKITYEETLEAFKNMTSEGGKFFNYMENAVKTASGQWSVLKDEFIGLGRAIGDSFLPFINDAISAITGLTRKFNDMTKAQREAVGKKMAIGLGAVAGGAATLKGWEIFMGTKGTRFNPVYTKSVNPILNKGGGLDKILQGLGLGAGSKAAYGYTAGLTGMVATVTTLLASAAIMGAILYTTKKVGDGLGVQFNTTQKANIYTDKDITLANAGPNKGQGTTIPGNSLNGGDVVTLADGSKITLFGKYSDKYKDSRDTVEETTDAVDDLTLKYEDQQEALKLYAEKVEEYDTEIQRIQNETGLNGVKKAIAIGNAEDALAQARVAALEVVTKAQLKAFEDLENATGQKSGSFMSWYMKQRGGSISASEYARVSAGGNISGINMRTGTLSSNVTSIGGVSTNNLNETGDLNDFISRPGGGIRSFSPNDTIIGVKQPQDLIGGQRINVNVNASNIVGQNAGEELAEILHDKLKTMVTI